MLECSALVHGAAMAMKRPSGRFFSTPEGVERRGPIAALDPHSLLLMGLGDTTRPLGSVGSMIGRRCSGVL